MATPGNRTGLSATAELRAAAPDGVDLPSGERCAEACRLWSGAVRHRPASHAAAAAELVEREAWLDMFAAAPPGAAAALGFSSCRIGGMGLLASGALAITECNRAMAAGIETTLTDADLRRTAAWFAARAVPSWAVQVSPAAGGKVRGLLARHGAAASGNGWAKFLLRAGAEGPRPASGVAVAPADAATAAVFGGVARSVFGFPAAAASWLAALVGRPGWHVYLATIGGEHAGAGATFVLGDRAWLGIGATLPGHRGRGVQRALIAQRVADARAAGATTLTSETAQPASPAEPGAASFRNLQRAGFEPVYTRPNFRIPPPETVARADPSA